MNSILFKRNWPLSLWTVLNKIPKTSGRYYAIQHTHILCYPEERLAQKCFATSSQAIEKPSELEQTFMKIQIDFTKHGFVNPIIFQKLLESMDCKKSIPFTTEQTLFLLESCTPEMMPSQNSSNRMELFMKLWKYLQKNDALEKRHYESFLKVHTENGMAIENVYTFLEERKLTQNSEMCEKLVQFACRLGDIRLATDVLAEMKTKDFALTENIFNALIMGHAENNDLTNALIILETMKAARIEPSSSTFTQLIGAYIKHNYIDKALEMFLKHAEKFNSGQIIRIIQMLTTVQEIDKKREFMNLLVKELPAEFIVCQEVAVPIRNLCTQLIHSGCVDEANFIIDCLPSPKFNENQDTDTFGYVFLQDLFRSKVQIKKIIKIANDFIVSRKNERALHIACNIAMRKNLDNAYPFFKELSKKEPLRPHYFWPLMLHKFRCNGEAGILEILKMMSELNVVCDFETLSYYVLPKLSVNLENPQQAIKTLEACGLKTSQSLSPIILQLISQQKLEEIVKIAQLYTSKLNTKEYVKPLAHLAVQIRATKRYEKYTTAIHTLYLKTSDPKTDFVGEILLEITKHNRLRDDVNILQRLITDLSRLGSKISPKSAELLNTHVVNIKVENTDIPYIRQLLLTMTDRKLNLQLTENINSNILLHPRDMTYDQLECHLLELESKNMNTRGVLRRLLQICVKENKLERALDLKKKCELAKVELSPGMMASIFDMYIKLEEYQAAKFSLRKLEETFPGFLLDEHKLLDFAALMIKNGELEETKQILIARATSNKVFGGDYVIKNVWNILNNVAYYAAQQTNLPSDKNLTKEMYFIVSKLRFCKAHNAILGPIIREYILRKDIHSAIAEFKLLAENFRHTPLQFELSSLLVRLSNKEDKENFNINKEEAKELLQQLTKTVTSIHGQINMNSSLLLAVAESGTEQQLRKLLINPEFRLNYDMLIKNCEHLNKEGSVRTLMRLAKACRGLNHVIKEHDVYNMLLMKFVEENNCTASLELFEKLEADDDLKISQEFLKNLINLLKVNNLKIPSSLSLRAHFIKT